MFLNFAMLGIGGAGVTIAKRYVGTLETWRSRVDDRIECLLRDRAKDVARRELETRFEASSQRHLNQIEEKIDKLDEKLEAKADKTVCMTLHRHGGNG